MLNSLIILDSWFIAMVSLTNSALTYIRFNNDEKRCHLQELKKMKIEYHTFYEIELNEIDWSYNELLKNIEACLIPDLARLIYEYTTNGINFNMILSKYNSRMEIYLFSNKSATDMILYNLFSGSTGSNNYDIVNINITFCPAIHKYILKHKDCMIDCTCTNPHYIYAMYGSLKKNEISIPSPRHNKLVRNIDNIYLAFKIFRHLIYDV